jgi:hypothetical protein
VKRENEREKKANFSSTNLNLSLFTGLSHLGRVREIYRSEAGRATCYTNTSPSKRHYIQEVEAFFREEAP